MIWLRAAGIVLAALLYAFIVACATVYLVRFWQAARRGMAGRRKDQARGEDFDWLGAIPAHVWLGALAVALWQVTLVGLLVVFWDHAVTWWGAPFIVAGDLAMLASLASAIWYEFRLVR